MNLYVLGVSMTITSMMVGIPLTMKFFTSRLQILEAIVWILSLASFSVGMSLWM